MRKSKRTWRKTPSFTGLRPASSLTSRVKKRNRSFDTLHELALRSELWRLGLRFRKNVETLPGKPDIVFPRARVAVFCDGDFWHGRRWRVLKGHLRSGSNASYWSAKIASNIQRDRRNTALLKKSGWRVLRVWEAEIKRNPGAVAAYVKKTVTVRQRRKS
jgi:DNA mismatch endonuclease (patch repair protein)